MLPTPTGPKHRRTAMQMGARNYFTKPYNDSDFITRYVKRRDPPAADGLNSTDGALRWEPIGLQWRRATMRGEAHRTTGVG